MHEGAYGAVVPGEAVHGGHPDVALEVLLNGADVLAGRAFHGIVSAVSGRIAYEAVGHRSGPDVSGAVPHDAGGNQHRTADAVGKVLVAHRQEGALQGVGVDGDGHPVEGGHHQPAGLAHGQARHHGPFGSVYDLNVRDAVVLLVVAPEAAP